MCSRAIAQNYKMNDVTIFDFQVTDFIFFVGKILLTSIVCYGAYAVFIYKPEWVKFPEKDINYVLTPVVIIGFGTYLVASLFFSVYEMAVETLFLCFCKYPTCKL